jgi:hypothetical protein
VCCSVLYDLSHKFFFRLLIILFNQYSAFPSFHLIETRRYFIHISVVQLAFSGSFRQEPHGLWELSCEILCRYTIMVQKSVCCWTVSLFPGRRGVALHGKIQWERRFVWRKHHTRHGPGQCHIALLAYRIRKLVPSRCDSKTSILAAISVLDLSKRP